MMIVILSLTIAAMAQSKPEAKLVKRFEYGCGTDCARELAIDIGAIQAMPGDSVAIRFCSAKPFPLALSIATAPPEPLIEALEGSYHYTGDRILFLRSPNCAVRMATIAATEYWFVPKGAALPPHREAFASDKVKINTLEASGGIGDADSYKRALTQLPRILKEEPKSTGIILGYYYKTPSSALKTRIKTITDRLRGSGIPGDQYFSIITPWPGERSSSYPEPKYPVMFVISTSISH